jgi:lysophospholipase L1-like esterase
VAEADYTDAGRAATIALTQQVNEVVRSAAVSGDATYVDLFAPFKGVAGDDDATPLLADDGDHPNAAGHQVIARALLAAGLLTPRPPPVVRAR